MKKCAYKKYFYCERSWALVYENSSFLTWLWYQSLIAFTAAGI